ncbi:MAG: hypothetical protein CML06_17320 [Pseudomonadales bacterium]|nr:hypothetical protein [Pseudomonadales bacterium]
MTMQKDITLFAQSYRQDDETEIQRYWRVLKLHKWLILGFIAAVTLATAAYVSQLTPIYRANTTVLIENQENRVLSIEEVYGLNTKDQEYYLTQFEILKSRDLAERVVRHLELEQHPLFALEKPGNLTDQQKFELVVDRFMNGLSVTPVRNTQLVKISYESPDPELAATITDTVAAQYIQHHMEERQGATVRATDWLSERLEDLRQTLQESEQRLQEYREEAELVDVRGVQTLDADEIAEITQRYVEAKEQRSQIETVYQQIQALGPNASPSQLMSIPSILGHELVRNFKQAKAQADARVEELSQRYGPKHPRMMAARTEARTADQQLYQQIRSVADGVKSNYEAARETERALQQQLAEAKGTLQDINRKEIKLRELQREVETNRNLFNMFLTRAKETEESRGLQSAHARIVDPAVAPLTPVRPKKTLSVLVAFIFSTLIAVGVAFLLESLRNTVRTGEDVEEKLGATLLGFLPLVKQGKSKATYRGFSEDTSSHFAESMRTIRTAFVLSGMEEHSKVVLVTSSIPDEGKSTVAMNLAEALSGMEKVLLIDSDMRRPSLAQVMGMDPHTPGMADLIHGKCSLKECVYKPQHSPISIMPTGNLKGINPLEVVSSKRIAALIKQLGQHYDRIIIDSPPVHAVSDPLVLATYSDTVVYVVKSDDTSAPLASKGLKNLRAVGAHISGVVLNQVNVKKAASYSPDSEHYFRDYGYGRPAMGSAKA